MYKAYGMIQPGASDTSAVHATTVIDQDGILRATDYYPMSNSRLISEFVHLVKGLQATDAHKVATLGRISRLTRLSYHRRPVLMTPRHA